MFDIEFKKRREKGKLLEEKERKRRITESYVDFCVISDTGSENLIIFVARFLFFHDGMVYEDYIFVI
mgnify:CR=1 FL=1